MRAVDGAAKRRLLFVGAEWVAALWPDGRQTVVRNVGAGQRLVLQ